MNDREIELYLRENGYPENICRGGRPGLERRWRMFVDEVQRGYKLGLEDYRNDLDLRGIIATLGIDKGESAAEIREADELFASLLIQTDRRIWESSAGNPFWDFGYPYNASGELKDDLRAEGFLNPI